MGDRALLTCPEGYAMFVLNSAAKFEVQLTKDESAEIKVVCDDEGWKLMDKISEPLPVCKKG